MASQITLKPQDLVAVLKLARLSPGVRTTFQTLGRSLALAPSAAHGSVGRARVARLLKQDELTADAVDRTALLEFVLHGARYAFPPSFGPVEAGLPTSHAASPLKALIAQPAELPPVWPSTQGTARGTSLHPLYPSVPMAARNDADLYELLALFDAVRAGNARERDLAARLLTERLS